MLKALIMGALLVAAPAQAQTVLSGGITREELSSTPNIRYIFDTADNYGWCGVYYTTGEAIGKAWLPPTAVQRVYLMGRGKKLPQKPPKTFIPAFDPDVRSYGLWPLKPKIDPITEPIFESHQ